MSIALGAPAPAGGGLRAAIAAAAVTIPHALGLGLLAYAPFGDDVPVAALALWSAALPGAVATIFARRPGVVYAPTTVVALLYAAILTTIYAAAPALGLSTRHVLAGCGATVALAFVFQWLFGALRLASIARFLPVSVMHGFAAGVGLAMIWGQVRGGFGAGGWAFTPTVLAHAVAAAAVLGIAHLSTRLFPRVPGLLPAVTVVAILVWVLGFGGLLAPATQDAAFALPPAPDYASLPWLALIQQQGSHLVALALLMAVVNSLDVLVFNQELDLEHNLRSEPNAALRTESLVGVVCAVAGLIPASTSASRTRIVLKQAPASAPAGQFHAAILLGVAVTGHWWLHWVPMAALAGALMLAGFTQVPASMWSRRYARAAPASWTQGWIVALVFPVAGGAGALLAGLLVATFVLLHATAGSAVRHAHLDGQVRSRRLRRAASEAWVAARMNRVAVIELQGVMSFGVAAHTAEQVRARLQPRHERVILDVQRVAAWDATALVQLKALGRDLAHGGRQLAVCGLDARSRAEIGAAVLQFTDLDHGLEWAEDALLEERPASERPAYPEDDLLGELGEGLAGEGRLALEVLLTRVQLAAGASIFLAGEAQRDLLIVQHGHVTLSTAWPPAAGLRLATVGQGMAFGEMAFLNGEPRTACAGAERGEVELARLSRAEFDAWAGRYPAEALVFLSNLALVGTRRLAATTRQLRMVLE